MVVAHMHSSKEQTKVSSMNWLSKSSVYLLLILGFAIMTTDCKPFHLHRGRRGNISLRSAIGPDTCATPSSKSGSCIPLIRCRAYWGRRNLPDLSNSSCDSETETRVCCPMFEDDETTITSTSSTKKPAPVSITTLASNLSTTSPQKIKATHKGRRTRLNSFPQNCGQSGATFRRIIGGQDSILGAWPWMAVIYFVRRGVRSAECGGSLITTTHVVTAAHCTVTARRGTTFNPRQLLVRLGEHNLDSENDGANPVDIQIRTIIKHENFNLRTFQNDISILELVQPVEISNQISPICLPFDVFQQEEELIDRNAIVAGWGSTRYGGPGNAALQEVALRIWNNEDCLEVFRRDVPITIVNLCAGDGDKDACRGDSGGPLMLADPSGRFFLVGIVSFGRKCAEPGIPGVFARVSAFLDWIEQKIG